ncbi:MAG: VWA domain-containing protein [Chthoniobacter sp.]|uniref:vWA domain-containing protein n=1 Tax=Chthoniobacter sp. TaxID=2510640 RepID=UPI0032A293F8
MHKISLLTLLGGLLALTASAASPTDLTLRVTPERDLLYSHGPREVVVQIDIDGRKPDSSHHTPMNLAVVLDRSGSMQGPKIEKARQAACLAIDQLASDDYFSLVIFDNETELLIPPDRVGDERHRDALKERVNHIGPRGGTAIYAGVKLGAEQLRRNFDKERVNRVILLSDGLANVGPSRPTDLATLGRDLRRDGVSVSTIGLGDDYNEDLMTALAEASEANYYYVKDAEKLPSIFAQELGATRSIVARGIIIRITVPEGVRLREIIGRPEIDCSGHTVQIQFPEYFGGDKRRFLARCVVEKAVSEPLDVAMVDLKYEATEGAKAAPQQQNARISFTDEERKSEDSLRPDVAKGVAILNNCLVKEKAVRLADEGRSKDAADLLRSQASINAAAPAPAQLPGVAEENRKLEAAAAEVESKGQLGKSSRKQIQYENWQDKNQKR